MAERKEIEEFLKNEGFTYDPGADQWIREADGQTESAVELNDTDRLLRYYLRLDRPDPGLTEESYDNLHVADGRLCLTRTTRGRKTTTVLIDRRRRISNIKKLREMSVPELAEFLKWHLKCDACMCRFDCAAMYGETGVNTDCGKNIENWLRAEAETGTDGKLICP